MFSIIWMLLRHFSYYAGLLVVFLIVTGIKYRKLLVGLMGLLSLSFVTLPFVLLSVGIHIDTIFPIPTALYWTLFSLTGLLAGVSGVQAKIKSIRNMGFIIFTIGILGVIFGSSCL